jgi:Gpi18-like mannosyltransferase
VLTERTRISPSRRERARALAWRLDTTVGLVALFGVAFAIRIALAPHFGFYGDLRLFQMWATRLDEVGPHKFYVPGQFADYPPGYLYVLWLLGKLSATPGYLLLKLPAIFADLGLAWLAGTLAARIAPTPLKERWPVRTLVAASVLFNPAVIGLSAVWGQVDAVPAAFVLASLLLLFTGPRSLDRELAAFGLFAVAIAMKPQSGFVLPVMLYALYRRYLHRRPRPELVDGALSIALSGALTLVVWGISGLAFGLGPVKLYRFYKHSASVYPVTSANAFNLWGVVGFWRSDSGYRIVGALALLAGIAFVLWLAHRAIERGAHEGRVLTVAAAIVSLLAYTLLTRMHERYMFLALAALAPLVFIRPLRWALAGLSGLFVLNLWYPYAYFNSQWGVQDFHYNPGFDWIFGGFATDTWQKKVWSAAVTAIALAVAWFGVRWAARTEPSADEPAPVEPARRPPRAQPVDDVAVSASAVSRWGPIALVALACVFCLVVLRGETKPADNLNDSAFHLQMVRWADGQIDEGRVPLDGWYPYLSLGSSQFHHYQSLPHTLTAYVARATGSSDQGTYLWIQYLLLALWPIAVFLGARLLGWINWVAAAAAAVSPLLISAPGYGYEHESYTWQGYGVYSQLWGMWLLPLAWGLTWRAVAHGKRHAAAALALALTIACHFITGYLALLTVGVWVLVFAGSDFLRRVGRAALVTAGSLVVASWVLVPLVGDAKWTTRSTYYQGTIFNDSYGARKVLAWLFKGQLFDSGRFPIVSLLVVAGVLVCASRVRDDPRARALLGAFALSLLLFFGRPTLGPVLDLLPGMKDVQIHRFIMGVHLAGILLAGVGLGWILQTAYRAALLRTPRYAARWAAGIVALGVGVLAPAWTDIGSYDRHGDVLLRAQRATDATEGRELDRFAAIVKARGGGRVYAGLRGNWGREYRVGYVPVYAALANRDVDAIGFTFRTIASLSTDVEASFDETNPAQYEMFDVRYLLLPPYREPGVPAKLIASRGIFRLFEVKTSGYLQVVDRAPAVEANRTDLDASTRSFRSSSDAVRGLYPGVAFDGGSAPPPTFDGGTRPTGSPGTVSSQSATLQDGVFNASVDANRPAVVLLKATYDPRWTATVDGLAAKPTMMAPSLVGVDVPVGHHEVRFRYAPYGRYPLLLVLGAFALVALALFPRRAELLRLLNVPTRAVRRAARPPA